MLNKKQLHILCHSLGLDDSGKGKSRRNYYCALNNSIEHKLCEQMVCLQLMKIENPAKTLSYTNTYFTVTNAGKIMLPLLLTGSILHLKLKENINDNHFKIRY